MKYIKTYEKRRYIKVGDYIKLREDQGLNMLPIVKIISGKGVFKNTTNADYYTEGFLHNLNNPEMYFESKWVEIWMSKKEIERLATEEEWLKQMKIADLILNSQKYNI